MVEPFRTQAIEEQILKFGSAAGAVIRGADGIDVSTPDENIQIILWNHKKVKK